jgi:hypothetical protein
MMTSDLSANLALCASLRFKISLQEKRGSIEPRKNNFDISFGFTSQRSRFITAGLRRFAGFFKVF